MNRKAGEFYVGNPSYRIDTNADRRGCCDLCSDYVPAQAEAEKDGRITDPGRSCYCR